MLKIYEFIKKKVNNTSIFIIVIIKLYYPLSLLHTLILILIIYPFLQYI